MPYYFELSKMKRNVLPKCVLPTYLHLPIEEEIRNYIYCCNWCKWSLVVCRLENRSHEMCINYRHFPHLIKQRNRIFLKRETASHHSLSFFLSIFLLFSFSRYDELLISSTFFLFISSYLPRKTFVHAKINQC